jgi:hypothetical protein
LRERERSARKRLEQPLELLDQRRHLLVVPAAAVQVPSELVHVAEEAASGTVVPVTGRDDGQAHGSGNGNGDGRDDRHDLKRSHQVVSSLCNGRATAPSMTRMEHGRVDALSGVLRLVKVCFEVLRRRGHEPVLRSSRGSG